MLGIGFSRSPAALADGGGLVITEMENFRFSFWLLSLSFASFFPSDLLG